MMTVEGSTITSRIKNLLRSPSIKLSRSKAGNRREDLGSKVSPTRPLAAFGLPRAASQSREGGEAAPTGGRALGGSWLRQLGEDQGRQELQSRMQM